MIRAGLTRSFDRLGLSARANDLRSHLAYATDRETRRLNADFREAGAPDGLPLPPPSLVYLVAGHFNLRWFYETGLDHARLVRKVLATNGVDIESFDKLLDFGCGCGRVLRHWLDLPSTRVHGSDYSPRPIRWCRHSLPFAEFSTNDLAPPLPYPAAEFDFIYAVSVFTHLTEELQPQWVAELERVLNPGGFLLVTTKGSSRLEALDAQERERFEAGQLVIKYGRYAGRNLCAAFHPESYLRQRFAPSLEFVDFVPADVGRSDGQDILLLRRPGA
jgi:SAM-dependent methyltransferase